MSTMPTKRPTVIRRAIATIRPKRAVWRQRLVDAEGGFKLFLRGDSALFVHLFTGVSVIIGGLLVGLSVIDWAIVVLCMSGVLIAELFHAALRLFATEAAGVGEETRRQLSRIAVAGVMTALGSAVLTMGLVFGRRVWELFG